jgi:porin
VNWQGTIPGRDEDRLGVGIAYVHLSRQMRNARKIAGDPFPPDYELVLETVYEASITPWFTLQPGLQWIHQPGGSDALPDAWVFLLRGILTF